MKPSKQAHLLRLASQMPGEWERLVRQLPQVFDRDDDSLYHDGFPNGSGAGGGSRTKGSHSDPTEGKVLAGALKDPFGEDLRSIGKYVDEIRTSTSHLRNLVERLLADGPTQDRVASVPDCLACGNLALPRPKSGYCGRCYMAWRREGSDDRTAFEARRRASVTTNEGVTTPDE